MDSRRIRRAAPLPNSVRVSALISSSGMWCSSVVRGCGFRACGVRQGVVAAGRGPHCANASRTGTAHGVTSRPRRSRNDPQGPLPRRGNRTILTGAGGGRRIGLRRRRVTRRRPGGGRRPGALPVGTGRVPARTRTAPSSSGVGSHPDGVRTPVGPGQGTQPRPGRAASPRRCCPGRAARRPRRGRAPPGRPSRRGETRRRAVGGDRHGLDVRRADRPVVDEQLAPQTDPCATTRSPPRPGRGCRRGRGPSRSRRSRRGMRRPSGGARRPAAPRRARRCAPAGPAPDDLRRGRRTSRSPSRPRRPP